jgi:hypothetical protein
MHCTARISTVAVGHPKVACRMKFRKTKQPDLSKLQTSRSRSANCFEKMISLLMAFEISGQTRSVTRGQIN